MRGRSGTFTPEGCFLGLPREESGAAGEGDQCVSPLPIFSLQVRGRAAARFCSDPPSQLPELPLAPLPARCGGCSWEWARHSPGAGLGLGAGSAPTWVAAQCPYPSPAGAGARGHVRPHSRPASRRGHVACRLCWERGPGHGKGPAKGLGVPPYDARLPTAEECGW